MHSFRFIAAFICDILCYVFIKLINKQWLTENINTHWTSRTQKFVT